MSRISRPVHARPPATDVSRRICSVVSIILLGVSPLVAQTTAVEPVSGDAPTAIQSEPSDSDTNLERSDTRKQKNEKNAKKKDVKESGFHWKDHPSLILGRETNIDFRLRLETHVLDSEAEVGDPSAFDIARRRVGVEGRIGGEVDFQIEREFATGGTWRDVYVDYRRFPSVRVQAGHFKLPFSLDENTSATNLDFAYRSRAASELAPGRDPGVMIHGRVLNSITRYEIGWFTHDGRNARSSNNPDRVYGQGTLAGRLSAQPFRTTKSPLSDLLVGVAFTQSGVPEGIAAVHGRTTLDASFFPARFWVQGQRRRTGIEARWRPGPFSVRTEYIRMSTERRGQSVEEIDLPPLVASGWYVSGTWLATGEQKAAGADRPRRPLLRGGFGAIELAARLEGLTFGSARLVDGVPSTSPRAEVVLPNSHRAITLGANWFPFRTVKIQANLIRESLSDPSRGPLPARPTFWSRVLRIQLAL